MQKVLEYLKQNIDSEAQITEWNPKNVLNFYIAGCYDYYLVCCLDKEFLMIKPKDMLTVKRIKDQMEYIEKITGFDVFLLLENSVAYRTKKFLEERVPFVSCDRQLYLPFMALHIKKQREKGAEIEVHEKFTASTQLMYLYILYKNKNVFSTEELATALKISPMTVSRGTNELEHIGLIHSEIGGKTGRKKLFTAIPQKEFYRLGKQFLQNPVKKVFL